MQVSDAFITAHSPVDARYYYQGLALENRSPQIDGVLGALLAKLEKDKPAVNLGDDDKMHCENFAVRVFTRADKIDRAGRADKTTATTYYAASIFIEASLAHFLTQSSMSHTGSSLTQMHMHRKPCASLAFCSLSLAQVNLSQGSCLTHAPLHNTYELTPLYEALGLNGQVGVCLYILTMKISPLPCLCIL